MIELRERVRHHVDLSIVSHEPPAQPTAFRVLLVDDDDSVLVTMQAVLEDAFAVEAHRSPRSALRALELRAAHVVIADWQMPEMDGLSFLAAVRERQPSIACLLVTGHVSDLLDTVPWDDRRTIALLSKPIDPRQLIARTEHLARLAALKDSSAALASASRRLKSGSK